MTRDQIITAARANWAYARLDAWVPACGGLEVPFTTRTGKRLLYVYNHAEGRHAYLDLGTDLILTDEEARLAIAI